MARGSDDSDGRRRKDQKDLSARIEGFGNAPMPPPVSDSFSDRIWDVVQEDKTLSDWFSFGKECLDDVVETFDGAVNAVVDAVDTMVDAVDGPLDADGNPAEPEGGEGSRGQYRLPPGSGDEPDGPDYPEGDLRRKAAKTKEKVKARRNRNDEDDDDGPSSGADWRTLVSTICEEGNLDDFIIAARSTPQSPAEERTIGNLLAEELLNAVSSDSTLRILYVMQACVEADLTVVVDQARSRCNVKLKKLQTQACFKKLVTDVMGLEKTESDKRAQVQDDTKRERVSAPAPQQDLLDMAVEAAPAPKNASAKPPAAQLDLLDMGGAPPAAAAPQDDLFGFEFQSAPAPTVSQQMQQNAQAPANFPRLAPPGTSSASASLSAGADAGLISFTPVAASSQSSASASSASFGFGGGYSASSPPPTDMFAANFPTTGAPPIQAPAFSNMSGVRAGPAMPPMAIGVRPGPVIHAPFSGPGRKPALGGKGAGAGAPSAASASDNAFGSDLGDAFALTKMHAPAAAASSSAGF